MLGLALCHGWGFDRRSMFALRSALADRFPSACIVEFDLGFTGSGMSPDPAYFERQGQWIAIGHSYGFAFLLQQAVPWKAAIALNGFTRFCKLPGKLAGKPHGMPQETVDATLFRLQADTPGTLCDFYLRCGASYAVPAYLDSALLSRHLRVLRELDLVLPAIPVLSISTENDETVTAELSEACFRGPLCKNLRYPGSHVSLLDRPQPSLAPIFDHIEAHIEHSTERLFL